MNKIPMKIDMLPGYVKKPAKNIHNVSVPCDDCTLCCRGDAISIHPELGDDASQYQTVPHFIPELAAKAGCGVLTPDTQPETLARAWAGLLADPERLRREAACGLAAVRTLFSCEACAAAFERAVS